MGTNTSNDQIGVGVIGLGAMGRHHVRVYKESPAANLVGVSDIDPTVATEIAAEYATEVLSKDELLSRVDAVSLVVPTQYHYEEAKQCIDAGVAVLIEKPAVADPEQGWDLIKYADQAGVPVQVGHIERFNPAIETIYDMVQNLDIIGIDAERLGPPPQREINDSAVIDLMIHDLDVITSLLDERPTSTASASVQKNRHTAAMLTFDSGVVATLTASRLTQRKVRRLNITAEDCLVEVDYLDQSVEIHRHSIPEYIEDNGDVRFRHESIIERPTVSSGEPLKKELEAFLEVVHTGAEPRVTLEEGIRALELAQEIENAGLESEQSNRVSKLKSEQSNRVSNHD